VGHNSSPLKLADEKTTIEHFFLICVGLSAQAMKIEVHKNLVFASGVVGDDVIAFQEAFAKPGVDTVVFVNSPGGDLWTGLRVGRMISDLGLKTVIAGACIFSCSIMFMGGKERTFSDAFSSPLTFIGTTIDLLCFTA
jgi:hypothetical protein